MGFHINPAMYLLCDFVQVVYLSDPQFSHHWSRDPTMQYFCEELNIELLVQCWPSVDTQ